MTASDQYKMSPVDDGGREVAAKSADLQRLLAYWHEWRGARAFPCRADIEPIDLRFMLDRITLVEIHGDVDRRYKLRLVGSWWAQKFGVEGTGTWLEDWPNPTQRQATLESYETLIARRRLILITRDGIADDNVLNFELLLLPFSEDGLQISSIVVGIGPR